MMKGPGPRGPHGPRGGMMKPGSMKGQGKILARLMKMIFH